MTELEALQKKYDALMAEHENLLAALKEYEKPEDSQVKKIRKLEMENERLEIEKAEVQAEKERLLNAEGQIDAN